MVKVLPVNQVIEAWKRMPSQIVGGQKRRSANPAQSAVSISIVDQLISLPAHSGVIVEESQRNSGCSSRPPAQ